MPVTVTVLYWNVQNFGALPGYKEDYGPLIQLIARVCNLAQADILYIQELKSGAVTRYYLTRLQQALNALPAPCNNWYYDWIKGAIKPGAAAPYASSADLD